MLEGVPTATDPHHDMFPLQQPHVDVFATDLILAISYPLDVRLATVIVFAATVILSLVGNI